MKNFKKTYADANEEFIEVDVTIAVSIEKAHESIGFVAGYTDLNLTKTRVELLGVNLVVTIERVEVSEGSSETSDGLSTTGLNLSSNFLENYSNRKNRN